MPDEITVHLDVGYDSARSRRLLDERGLHGRIAHKGTKAPVQATHRWHVERTHDWNGASRHAATLCSRSSVSPAFFPPATLA